MRVGHVAVARARAAQTRLPSNLPLPPGDVRHCWVEDWLDTDELAEIRRTTQLPIGCDDFEAEWRFIAMVHARRKRQAAREGYFAEHGIARADECKVWPPAGRPVWRDGYGTDYPRRATKRRGNLTTGVAS